MKLETIEFENKEKFNAAIGAVLSGEEKFRTYKTKSGEDKTVKIISNKRLYVGNNFSIAMNQADNGKVYVSIDYFGAEDRIRIAQTQKTDLSNEL